MYLKDAKKIIGSYISYVLKLWRVYQSKSQIRAAITSNLPMFLELGFRANNKTLTSDAISGALCVYKAK